MTTLTEIPSGHPTKTLAFDPARRILKPQGNVWLIPLVLLTVLALPSVAQEKSAAAPLTLEQAVQQALAKNPQLQSEEDSVAAAGARADAAKAAWLPRIDFSEGLTRGNNPVYVFGTLLTQRRFSAADFDLARLNTPTPLNNFQTRLGGQMLLFDSGQRRYVIQAAKRAMTAADYEKEQARQDLILRVVKEYYGVIVAREGLAAADESLRAAEANQERATHMQKAGLIVDSDLLSAKVFTAQMKDREIRAKNGIKLAELTLGRELGMAAGEAPEVTGELREPTMDLKAPEDWEKTALEERPMLKAAEMGHDAATNARKAARAEFGPKLGAFAAVERDSISFAGIGGSNWTAGARLDFNLFAGGAQKARLAEARANENKVKHDLEWARSGVLLQVRQAYLGANAAEQRAAAARDSAEQAKESLRIIQNRYETGLTTITELLRAQAAQLDARTAYLSAVYDWHTALAELEQAAGALTIDAAHLEGEKKP